MKGGSSWELNRNLLTTCTMTRKKDSVHPLRCPFEEKRKKACCYKMAVMKLGLTKKLWLIVIISTKAKDMKQHMHIC